MVHRCGHCKREVEGGFLCLACERHPEPRITRVCPGCALGHARQEHTGQQPPPWPRHPSWNVARCNARQPGGETCDREAGHEGFHRTGQVSWV